MKKHIIALVITGFFGFLSIQNAAAIPWIDWETTSSGSLTVGSTSIGVSMTGNPIALVNGDYYYNNGNTGGTSPSGTYGGLAPSDLIQVNAGGSYTLTFEEAIINPYIALVSVGRSYLPITYDFNDPFSVISSGSNYWGYTGYSTSGDDFTGREFNGVLQFAGTFSSISFGIGPNEYWHGFNFGVEDVAVPEPSTLLLLSVGLIGIAASRKRLT